MKQSKELEQKLAEIKEKQRDILAVFMQCFDNPSGEKVLEFLDSYSHKNFPQYDNVNATYSKIGEQTLVDLIKGIVHKAKTLGQ